MQTLPAKVKRPTLTALFGSLFLLGICTAVGAQGTARVSSQEAAGYVVFPKIVVDTSGVFTNGISVDTVVQLTNVSGEMVTVDCYYVNATGECSNAPGTYCRTSGDCPTGGSCVPNCAASDFTLTLTPGQPIAWSVSAPPAFLPCDPLDPPASCIGENEGGIPPVSSEVFQGELKCVQVDDADSPIARNDLKGEATIYGVRAGDPPIVDVATYNAIGIQAVVGANNGDSELVLGGDNPEYAACPLILVLDHFFEFARSPFDPSNRVVTKLTLVPCTEDLLGSTPPITTPAQMLIYNEFEQRFSTSRRVTCYDNIWLSDIDTRPGTSDNIYSIFSVGTQGTLTGQTRIRGVQSGDLGHGFLAVAQEVQIDDAWTAVGSAAFNVNYIGERSHADIVTLHLP